MKKKMNLIILIAVIAVMFVIIPQAGSTYLLNIITLMCLYLAMSQMWNLLGGYAACCLSVCRLLLESAVIH